MHITDKHCKKDKSISFFNKANKNCADFIINIILFPSKILIKKCFLISYADEQF